jgi:ATP-dependent Clp protease ATP-binding subunit ClpB
MASENSPSTISADFLIRGSDRLAANPDFKLIGRKDELNAAMDVLLRKTTGNNLVLHGLSGVGISSIVMGLQKAKEESGTPFDIVSKEFYYLDTDALFSTSDPAAIESGFNKAIETLSSSENAVLVIEDTKGFINGVKDNNASNVVNVLMRTARTNPKIQIIFESGADDLGSLLAAHSDITKDFAVQEIGKPTKEDQRAIVEHAAKKMEEQYGIAISGKAIDSVLKLTEKYPGITRKTGVAQPKCAIVLLEGAMTAYQRDAHAKPEGMAELEETLENVARALEKGIPAKGDLADKSQDELAAIKVETETSIEQLNAAWDEQQKELRALCGAQAQGERALQEVNAEIAAQKQKEIDTKKAREAYNRAEGDPQAQKQVLEDYEGQYGEKLMVRQSQEAAPDIVKKQTVNTDMYSRFSDNNLAGDSEEVQALLERRASIAEALKENEEKYKELTKSLNEGLELAEEQVLAEFSRISKIDLTKLQQDETEKLMNLESTIKQRVFGQEEAISAVAKAVRRGKAGLKKPNKPIGTFLFLGPTGVGKTELAKAVTEALFGTEEALHVYNMPEYSEKNAVTRMIGSPPGYEGYEQGGQLTNDMMREPSCVNLFDEAEKAHVDMFDILLRLADEGRLEDNHGREVFFGDTINIITSNIGAKYFLDESLSFEEAKKKAEEDLYRHTDPITGKEEGFRPEFIKRLNGVFCFQKLDNGQIKLVALKNLKELNGWLAEGEKGVTVEMEEKDLEAMCKDNYNPQDGARGVQNYIADTITSDVSDTVLLNPGKHGTVKVSYASGKGVTTDFQESSAPKAANTDAPPAEKKKAAASKPKPN